VVAEPERPLVPQRDGRANWRARLPLQGRWVAEAAGLQAEAAQEPQQPLAGALLWPPLQVLES
jgi:hypothetical protein